MTASKALKKIKEKSDKTKGEFLVRFFKTGKGEYGEGDVFLGLTVPQSRVISKEFLNLPFEELKTLLESKYHEARLVALHILTYRFQKSDEKEQKKIYEFYLKNIKGVNNWDLVDTSAPGIAGGYLFSRDRKILFKLVKSKNLWERRIAIVGTYYFIKKDDFKDTLRISEMLLSDKEDLIHKAVGWMLREVGKKDEKVLCDFLDKNYKSMPRTTLRYAIEKFDDRKRLYYLKKQA